MKLNSILVLLTVLVTLAITNVRADVLTLDADLEDKNSMTWPMLPGESISELAAKFYPNNKGMQSKFTAKTLRLNAETMPKLSAQTDFSVPTALIIPTLKSLSNSTRAIKSAHQKSDRSALQLTYNMKTALENVPKSLLLEYDNLLSRNAFLKEELARLNEKLVFLQSKLNELKLILDKTLTLPQKKVFKNLDAKPAQNQSASKAVAPAETPSFLSSVFDPINKDLLWAALGLGLATLLISFALKKYRETMYKKFVIQTEREALVPSFTDGGETVELGEGARMNMPLGAETQVDDLNERSILDEAKFFMSKNQPNEAIEHIKWAIRAQPKMAINLWLYLLDIFRQENLQEEFENYAKALHQTFNVQTPVWEEKALPLVIAQSLEEFPHIVEKLTASWPSEESRSYLRHLIADNRNGERTGFGKAVLDEILLLIAVFDARGELI